MGGGGSKAQTSIEALSQQITNVSTNLVQNCTIKVDQNQSLASVNTGLIYGQDIDMSQVTDVDFTCIATADRETKLQNEIMNKITQLNTATGDAIWSSIGGSETDAKVKMENLIRNNITMSSIQNTYTDIRQNQDITLVNAGIIIKQDIDMSQGAEVFGLAVNKTVEDAGIYNEIKSKLDQENKSLTKSPMSALADMFKSAMMMWVMIFLVIVAAVGIGAFIFFKSGGSLSSLAKLTPMGRAASMVTSKSKSKSSTPPT